MSVVHAEAAAPARLMHLPLALFAAPMGIGGLGLAWREAAHGLAAPAVIGEALLALAGLVWLGVAALHGVRLVHHPEALAADLRHPIRAAFAGAVTIGLMILAGGLIPHAPQAAAVLWLVAVGAHVAIGVWTVRGLLGAPREAAGLAPPLLIPLVGNVLAPVFGMKLGFVVLSQMLLGLGALLWLLIQPLILMRLVTGPALPARLLPTLVILLAPPAVGSLALAAVSGGFGAGAFAVFGLAAFVALVLAAMVPGFARVPFAMSWWGWTFPTAAFAIACQAAAKAAPAAWQAPLLWLVLLAASAILGVVVVATLRAWASGHLLQPE